jgi:hypothetical protein
LFAAGGGPLAVGAAPAVAPTLLAEGPSLNVDASAVYRGKQAAHPWGRTQERLTV